MSRNLMLTLLSKGNNGTELLQILDSLSDDNQETVVEPTADVIEF